MSYCRNCGQRITSDARSCPKCGHDQNPQRPGTRSGFKFFFGGCVLLPIVLILVVLLIVAANGFIRGLLGY